MRKLFYISILAIFLAGYGLSYLTAGEKDKMAKPTTIQGTLVDSKCYLSGVAMGNPPMNFGNKHKVPGKDKSMMEVPSCATACANMGIPAAIVEGEVPGGKTYIIVAPASMFAEHMTKTAKITGILADNGALIAKKVEIKDGNQWKEIPIPSMM
jgi:hypothetical protein